MGLENPTYISDFNTSWPLDADNINEGNEHIQRIKSAIQATLPNLDGAMTSTQAELNILDGCTATTAELNILDGVTATTAELNIMDGVTATASEISLLEGGAAAASITVADADAVILDDGGTMKRVLVTALKNYIKTWRYLGELNSGNSWELTTVPSGTTQINLAIDVISNSTSSDSIGFQIGDSSYSSTSNTSAVYANGLTSKQNMLTGGKAIIVTDDAANSDTFSGMVSLQKRNSNFWTYQGVVSSATDTSMCTSGGLIQITNEAERIKMVADSGAVDAGTVHVWCYY
jgi:hypothetical protein